MTPPSVLLAVKPKKWLIRWRLIGISLGASALMFVIGYVVAVRLLFPPLPEPKNGIVVPPLSGLLVPSAEARLREIGLRVSEIVELAHPSQPAGLIIAQSPLPGQQLRIAGSVRLGVSAGIPRLDSVPPVAPQRPPPADSVPPESDSLRVAPDTLH